MDPACLLMYMGLLIHMAYGHLYIEMSFCIEGQDDIILSMRSKFKM